MSEVSSGEDSVYLAYFEEAHYMSGHYQSIKPAQSLMVEEEVASVPGALISTLASQAVEVAVADKSTFLSEHTGSLLSTLALTQTFFPPESSTIRIPIIKLRKTRDGWSKVSF